MTEEAMLPTGAGCRKDAYAQVYRGPVRFEDRKGTWEVGWMNRDYYGPSRRFRLDVALTPAAGLKATGHTRSYIYVYDSQTLEAFKDAIKFSIGYTPTDQVLKQMFGVMEQLRAALMEEDHYYETADETVAQKVLEGLRNRAAGRFRRGEYQVPESSRHHYQYRPCDLYLTREEREAATEAQKVINGSGMHGDSHLKAFGDEINQAIAAIKRQQEAEALRQKRKRLDRLMETDPDFRRLVAHYAKATEAAQGEVYLELAYRLFGYCKSLAEWHEVVSSYSSLLKQYELDMFSVKELQRLAEAEFDVLPQVESKYDRKAGEFYYGDQVVVGGTGRSYTVQRCGREYAELSGAGRQRKGLLQHYKTWLRTRQRATG